MEGGECYVSNVLEWCANGPLLMILACFSFWWGHLCVSLMHSEPGAWYCWGINAVTLAVSVSTSISYLLKIASSKHPQGKFTKEGIPPIKRFHGINLSLWYIYIYISFRIHSLGNIIRKLPLKGKSSWRQICQFCSYAICGTPSLLPPRSIACAILLWPFLRTWSLTGL